MSWYKDTSLHFINNPVPMCHILYGTVRLSVVGVQIMKNNWQAKLVVGPKNEGPKVIRLYVGTHGSKQGDNIHLTAQKKKPLWVVSDHWLAGEQQCVSAGVATPVVLWWATVLVGILFPCVCMCVFACIHCWVKEGEGMIFPTIVNQVQLSSQYAVLPLSFVKEDSCSVIDHMSLNCV